uniref:Ig-like domain-containing protein n=1 Tax=Panagrellus redivivus TaxID=6233 RepID=A0A7E4UVU2_PANRE
MTYASGTLVCQGHSHRRRRRPPQVESKSSFMVPPWSSRESVVSSNKITEHNHRRRERQTLKCRRLCYQLNCIAFWWTKNGMPLFGDGGDTAEKKDGWKQ